MKYSFIILFLIAFLSLSAQKRKFTLNEHGSYIYYEVVDAKTAKKDSLMLRARYFINNLHKKMIKQESLTDTSILANGKLIIDKMLLVATHPSGEVSYHLTFEARDQKYRFWLTDFTYIPYQRDRYGNYVLITHLGTALEKSPGKLSVGEWKGIIESVEIETGKLAADLKNILATNQSEKIRKETEIIATGTW